MRLPRPYISYRLRVQVAEREFKRRFGYFPSDPDIFGGNKTPLKTRLARLLLAIFGDVKVHLHHSPALCNREWLGHLVVPRYVPDACDPDYLFYLVAGAGEEHDIETRVRGQHGQHSDLGLRRKLKRMHAKRVPRGTKGIWGTTRKRPRRRLRGRGFDKTRRRKVSGGVVPREP